MINTMLPQRTAWLHIAAKRGKAAFQPRKSLHACCNRTRDAASAAEPARPTPRRPQTVSCESNQCKVPAKPPMPSNSCVANHKRSLPLHIWRSHSKRRATKRQKHHPRWWHQNAWSRLRRLLKHATPAKRQHRISLCASSVRSSFRHGEAFTGMATRTNAAASAQQFAVPIDAAGLQSC